MTDEELIARLRAWAKDIQAGSKAIWAMDQDLKEAADRIEALVAERDAALPAAPTFTAADLERAWEMGRDAAATAAQGPYRSVSNYSPESPFYGSDMTPDRSDMGRGIQAGRDKAVSGIRAITPPADLAQRVKKGPAHD